MILKDICCPNCGNKAEVNYADSMIDGKVRWYESQRCTICDYAKEVDGLGPLPSEMRDELIAKKGKWQLCIKAYEHKTASVLHAIQKALGLSLEEVIPYRERIPGCIADGTKTEMNYLEYCVHESIPDLEIEISLLSSPIPHQSE